jgi:hypothetical protein
VSDLEKRKNITQNLNTNFYIIFLYIRQILTTKLFNDIVNDESHKLYQLLPSKNFSNYNMRKENIFNVSISRTNRFKNSFIQHNSTMYFR